MEMNTKMTITRHTKELAARYLVRVLMDADGCVAFSKFYDGTSHTAESLRDALGISGADALWLVPEVVLKTTIEDMQRLGCLEIQSISRKKLANTQRDFHVSLTSQGSQELLAGKLPEFADSTLEAWDCYPVKSRAQRRKTGAEPTRRIRASEIGLRLTRSMELRSEELTAWTHQFECRYGALMEEAKAIHRLSTEQPEELDPRRVTRAEQTLAVLETERKQFKEEQSWILSMTAMVLRLLKIKSTISGTLAERLLDGADQGDWKYVEAIQQHLVDHGPRAQLKSMLKLEQDDWCGAFLALAHKKKAAKTSRTR